MEKSEKVTYELMSKLPDGYFRLLIKNIMQINVPIHMQ